MIKASLFTILWRGGVPRVGCCQGDQKIRKNHQIFQRIAQKVAKSKKGQNVNNKAQFKGPKHLHQTTFKTLEYLQQTMFWNCLFR